ncbi:MAG: Ax21 family protein [Lysobacteraceae bacterium]|nr:MAG: Ax21 family protein [Xanthomonadaceae bacterium]
MRRSLLALTLLVALPFTASAAEGLSYNYVQGGYVATNGDADADGFGIDGSFAVHPNFHLFGGYNRQEIEDTNIDVDQWRVGAGYNQDITDKVDLVTRIAYEKFDAGGGFDFDGYSAEVGVRGAMSERIEAYVSAGYEDYEQFDGDFYGQVGAQVKFHENWGLSGDVKFADGDAQWFIGPRVTW